MEKDKVLLEKYRNGDIMAFEQFYNRYKNQLYSYIYSILGASAVAEEVLQDLFIELIKKVDSLQVRGELKAYLYTAARNRSISVLRNEKVKTRCLKEMLNMKLVHANGQLDAFDYTIKTEQEKTINSAIANLPPEQREVVVLRIYHDLTFEEIADVCDAPQGTVTSRYKYAIEKLRENLFKEKTHG